MTENVKIIVERSETFFIPSPETLHTAFAVSRDYDRVDQAVSDALVEINDAALPPELEIHFQVALLRAVDSAPECQITNIQQVLVEFRKLIAER